MGFEVKGMNELLKKLRNIGEKGQPIAEEALKAGAEILQQKMKELAPRSTLNKKHLADNIIISAIKDGKLEIGPHKDFFYAHFLEFGTSTISPQPFAQKAFELCKGQIQQKMADVIRSGLGL
ncbi:HK97-gp10 family putative phage morphogenesis protein [Cytobacillus sp. Hm23]